MQLQFSSDREVLSVRISGRIVGTEIDPSRDEFKEFAADVYGRKALLSLSQVDYLDSSGVSWLLNLHKSFRTAGGCVILHSVDPMVMQVLRVLKLDKVFLIAPSEAAARKMLEEVPA